MGVLTQHMFVEPVPPSQVAEAARWLGSLEEITLTCLTKKREKRFASMDQVIRALDRVVQLGGDEDSDFASRLAPLTGPLSASVRPEATDPLDPPSFHELRGAIDERAARSQGAVGRSRRGDHGRRGRGHRGRALAGAEGAPPRALRDGGPRSASASHRRRAGGRALECRVPRSPGPGPGDPRPRCR